MTPKEKADELISKFLDIDGVNNSLDPYINIENAKQCALICVDEAQKATGFFDYKAKMEYSYQSACKNNQFTTYWEEVKTEIEKL